MHGDPKRSLQKVRIEAWFGATLKAPRLRFLTGDGLLIEGTGLTLAGTAFGERREAEEWREPGIGPAQEPGADQGACQGSQGVNLAFADVDKDGSRAHTRDAPADAEEGPADKVSPVKGFRRGGPSCLLYESQARNRHSQGPGEDAKKLEVPEKEHALDEAIVRRAAAAQDKTEDPAKDDKKEAVHKTVPENVNTNL